MPNLLLTLIVLIPLNLFAQQMNVKSTLEIYDIASESRSVFYEEADHFEAPNWSPNDDYLLINQRGGLYRIDLQSKQKTKLSTGFADKINNDHGISFDGQWLAISHHALAEPEAGEAPKTGSRIYVLPVDGGTPKPVTPKVPSYWHGWSPNGQTLVYCAERNGEYDVYSIPVSGGNEKQLTNQPGLDDGPEYSPDGKYIYYNSMASGKMELWRMDANGENKTQLTSDSFSNWFPHPSPCGKKLVYISYLKDQGSSHPPMKDVALRLMDIESGKIQTLCTFTGGQGTINVPSWSPDGKRFAFVSYEFLK